MLSPGPLILRYGAFAAVSTIANILAQEASLGVYHGENGLAVSIVVGTGMGFIVKYMLDKYWIFFDRTSAPSTELWKVVLYGLSGILTTLVFWATEVGFWLAWGTDIAKYAGAVLGLTIGYFVKYFIDRRFVFVRVQITC